MGPVTQCCSVFRMRSDQDYREHLQKAHTSVDRACIGAESGYYSEFNLEMSGTWFEAEDDIEHCCLLKKTYT
jgi:hypothetical protein